ncbi:MAG: amidase, partial [Rhodoferax sp.]|nr:amidase [Rhodoferax sp.]
RNPWHPERIPGGSSGGSAVAVATGMVFGALGSDTAGSVRLPAAMCGVVGMKTTYGRVSRAGAMPLSHSLDTVGPLTRTVADNALLLSVIAGQDPRDASTPPIAVPDYPALLDGPVHGLRVGLPRGYFDRELHPDVAQRLRAMAAHCRDLGMQLVDIDMPDLDEVNAVGFLLTWGDVIGIHGTWMRERAADYTPQVQGRILTTLAATLPGYLAAQRLRGPMLREFDDRVFGRCDLLLAPVLPFPVPRLSDVDTSGGASTIRILNEITRLMRPINVLGLPALSLPGGATPDGLPCGLQLIGRPYAEALLYRVGHALEQAQGGFASPGPGARSG